MRNRINATFVFVNIIKSDKNKLFSEDEMEIKKSRFSLNNGQNYFEFLKFFQKLFPYDLKLASIFENSNNFQRTFE